MEEMKDTPVELKAQFYQIRQVSVHELLPSDSLETLKSMTAFPTHFGIDKFTTSKPSAGAKVSSETTIEIFEGPQGNVILKGLREIKLTSPKDLALIYEAAVSIASTTHRREASPSRPLFPATWFTT